MIREFSAGGVTVRNFRGRPFVVAVRVKGGTVLALPKGQIDAGERAVEAAAREVREEAGVTGELVEKLGDVRYWYQRGGERVLKVVSFFLFRYRSGSVRDHDHEVDSAEWVPLEDAPRLLAYKGEREMAEAALSRLRADR
ncbi:MAG TPA: NUDIX domain-containing protein [Thermoleophilaceae bacterium]